MNDIKISGSGSVSGGEYNNVKISGSGHVNGDISCRSFAASGSTKVDGNIKCDDFASSGSSHVKGMMDCSGALASSGSLVVNGSLHVDTARCSGSLKVSDDMDAREVQLSGTASIGGGLSAEKVVISGSAKIRGLLNAEVADISVGWGNTECDIGSIGGGSITVKRKMGGMVFGMRKYMYCIFLHTTSIEADMVEIECTEAQTVRAIDAVIGDGCNIGTVEYSGTLTVSDNATVGKTVKI